MRFVREILVFHSCRYINSARFMAFNLLIGRKTTLRGVLMKIVVVKSPKLLAGFLRFFFKIKKEQVV